MAEKGPFAPLVVAGIRRGAEIGAAGGRVKRVDLSGGGMILALAQVATGERLMLCRTRALYTRLEGKSGYRSRLKVLTAAGQESDLSHQCKIKPVVRVAQRLIFTLKRAARLPFFRAFLLQR
jgi:hypothetical protein